MAEAARPLSALLPGVSTDFGTCDAKQKAHLAFQPEVHLAFRHVSGVPLSLLLHHYPKAFWTTPCRCKQTDRYLVAAHQLTPVMISKNMCVCRPPHTIYTLEDLGIDQAQRQAPSSFGASEPFPFLSAPGCQALLTELGRDEIQQNCTFSIDRIPW